MKNLLAQQLTMEKNQMVCFKKLLIKNLLTKSITEKKNLHLKKFEKLLKSNRFLSCNLKNREVNKTQAVIKQCKDLIFFHIKNISKTR